MLVVSKKLTSSSRNANNGDANGLKPTNGDVTHEEDEKDHNVSATVA